jgi:rhodanese-related sulfurtransferase
MEAGFEMVDVGEARSELARGAATAVDARSDVEWGQGHVIGAIHLPQGQRCWRTAMLDDGARVMVIAEDLLHSTWAAMRLTEQGYDAVAVDGGTEPWCAPGFNLPWGRVADPYTGLGLD